MNNWLNKDRSETHVNRSIDRLTNHGILVKNPALAINVYKNAIPKNYCEDSISVLENNLGPDKFYDWQKASVTESKTPMLDARNCLDFKVGRKNLGEENHINKPFYDMHKILFDQIYECSVDYSESWGVGIRYFEAFNFVKYEGKNTHFNIHADHGPAYIATVSIVGYLNDEYVGGELYFPRFDLTIKPEVGDLVVFPSSFVYEHASLPIIEGTKYSIVIMTDYNDRGGNRYYQYLDQEDKLTY